MKQVIFATFLSLVCTSLTWAESAREVSLGQNQISCISNFSGGFGYVDGVKQCQYFCKSACLGKFDVIAGSAEGDFGAYNCYGAIIKIQASPNGNLSANAMGYESFTVTVSGVKSYLSAWKYGTLFEQLEQIHTERNCQR